MLEALDDTNRFYASRFYNQPGHELTTEQLLAHYIANAEIGMTITGFDVQAAPDHLEQRISPMLINLSEHEVELFAGAD